MKSRYSRKVHSKKIRRRRNKTCKRCNKICKRKSQKGG